MPSITSVFRWLAAFLMLIPLSTLSGTKPLSDLEREAHQILAEPNNVQRRHRIAPVFDLAERYGAIGETPKALEYYGKALEHEPWNLEAQLAMAQLLHQTGETNRARDKAGLVWNRAETDALLGGAAKLLGHPFDPKLSHEPWPQKPNALALIPVGEVEAWLLNDLRDELPKLLGIPVVIQNFPLSVPKPGREPLRLRAEELRERIKKSDLDPQFRTLLRQHKLSTKGLDSDEKVFAFTEAFLSAVNREDARQFQEDLAGLRRLGPQWDAAEIVAQMQGTCAPERGSGRGYLGITAMDLYSAETRFLFGLAATGGNCGVLSYRRYAAALWAEPPNRQRLKERTLKQALSSACLLFGMPRCTDPTCARAYAHSLAEHDAKQVRLCPECQGALARRFGKAG